MGIRRFNFFHPNDGTVPYPNNSDCDNTVLWERISDLQNFTDIQRIRIDELVQQLQQYQGRVMAGDMVPVRDEQRIDRYMVRNFEDPNILYQQMRHQQLNRLASELLENNFINHTFRVEEPDGDYISRMEIRVARNN